MLVQWFIITLILTHCKILWNYANEKKIITDMFFDQKTSYPVDSLLSVYSLGQVNFKGLSSSWLMLMAVHLSSYSAYLTNGSF